MPDTLIATYSFILPQLRFPYDALELYMDAQTLEIHHTKYHAAYITALHALIANQSQLHGISIEEVLRRLDTVPVSIRENVAFHAGGHANHQFLWKILPSGPPTEPKEALKTAINQAFGDREFLLSKHNYDWLITTANHQRIWENR